MHKICLGCKCASMWNASALLPFLTLLVWDRRTVDKNVCSCGLCSICLCKCSALGAPVSVNPHTSIECTICVWDTYHVHGYAWGHTSIYILFSVCLMHDQKSLKPCKRSNHIQWAPCMPVILQTSMSPRPRSYHEHPPEEFEFKCEISVDKLKYKICPHWFCT